jgi:O-antigen ligase
MPEAAKVADRLFDRARLARLAGCLAIAVAVSLPWSTSATGILIFLWLLAVLPTVSPAEVRRELANPAAGLAVALWALGIVGMAWGEGSLAERLYAIKGFHKLLVIPLLLIQFRRSDKGLWVVGGFLVSATALLLLSWITHVWPWLFWPRIRAGLPVKDYITQSAEFLICAFALGHLAVDAWRKDRRAVSLAFGALGILFLGNVAFVVTGRTSLAAFPVLLILFGVQRFGWKGTVALALAGGVLAAVAWASSPYLRMRSLGVIDEIHRYQIEHAATSSGYRLEFWKKSVEFVAAAPLVGHGTGSIETLFRRAAVGEGMSAVITGNPHNQTLEIAIQFGLIGVSLLYAMWIAHVLMFRGNGLAAMLGMALVAQGIVGSLFLSYLFDFTTGWIYMFGVGVLGGMALAQKAQGCDPGHGNGIER